MKADLKMENVNQQKAWDIAKTVKSKQKVVNILNPYLSIYTVLGQVFYNFPKMLLLQVVFMYLAVQLINVTPHTSIFTLKDISHFLFLSSFSDNCHTLRHFTLPILIQFQ